MRDPVPLDPHDVPLLRMSVSRDGPGAYDDLLPALGAHAAANADDIGYRERRDELVTAFLPLVRNLARRYASDGNADDIEQVGIIGLIKAIDRYDPELSPRGPLSYLVPSVQGEMKRHLRDRTWSVKVPRGTKELAVAVDRASTALTNELGRSPRVSELATRLEVTVDDVVDALNALDSYQTRSLDVSDPVTGTSLGDRVGSEDDTLGVAEIRGDLRRAIAALPDRERTVLLLRFYGNQTQSEIGQRIGVSQMHVSRLVTTSLALLREHLDGPADLPDAAAG
ncbi:RNA polymerase sigma-37 (RpsB/SigB) subunit [Pseudonocardia endophytica]|uniref:RNA polymerase sigma-37 (RpsB/SigB) subunit n=2 Tax=Pseudonocardia endophytica TaxID=401976 RepID=A0A4R1HHR0_PSEEN|nr:RNA polymerase sigma-37 (RpsB/SigB) subunit [Pseudonocardia endophytica]